MSDANRTAVYKIVSEMLDNPDESGIYPTTKCYDALEALLDAKDVELAAALAHAEKAEAGRADLCKQICEYIAAYDGASDPTAAGSTCRLIRAESDLRDVVEKEKTKRRLHGHPCELGCADCYGPFGAEIHSVSDGFGNTWRCRLNYLGPTTKKETPCGLEVVRPGKVQCWCGTEDRQMSGTSEEKELAPMKLAPGAQILEINWADKIVSIGTNHAKPIGTEQDQIGVPGKEKGA